MKALEILNTLSKKLEKFAGKHQNGETKIIIDYNDNRFEISRNHNRINAYLNGEPTDFGLNVDTATDSDVHEFGLNLYEFIFNCEF